MQPNIAKICNFCGKDSPAVARLIDGPGIAICNECIGLCLDICAEEGVPTRMVWREPRHLKWHVGPQTGRTLYTGEGRGKLMAMFDEPADAALASAAPDLLDVAQDLEWQECVDETFACAWCQASKRYKADVGVHEPKCALAAAIKKAKTTPLKVL